MPEPPRAAASPAVACQQPVDSVHANAPPARHVRARGCVWHVQPRTAHGLNGARSIQRRLAARVVSPLQQLADASPGETMWRVVRRVTRWAHHEPRFRWLFPWALARAKQSYERATDAAA